jgi:hypothetical protein
VWMPFLALDAPALSLLGDAAVTPLFGGSGSALALALALALPVIWLWLWLWALSGLSLAGCRCSWTRLPLDACFGCGIPSLTGLASLRLPG